MEITLSQQHNVGEKETTLGQQYDVGEKDTRKAKTEAILYTIKHSIIRMAGQYFLTGGCSEGLGAF